jgi:hypothetical protein
VEKNKVSVLRFLEHVFVPSATPTPFLRVVGECFIWSIPATILILLLIRFGWRRNKGMEDV